MRLFRVLPVSRGLLVPGLHAGRFQTIRFHLSDPHSHSHSSLPAPRSHHHSHTHGPNDLLLETKSSPATRITWIGLALNIAMVVSKVVGGVYFHSQLLLADAVHLFLDLVLDLLTLGTVSLSRRPPSESFPNGLGKIEPLGALAVLALLVTAGLSIGWSSVVGVATTVMPDSVFAFTEWAALWHLADPPRAVQTAPPVDINAAWLAGGLVVVKEWLFRATLKVGQQEQLQVLVANAWHHRVDALTSLVAVAAIGGSHVFGIGWLDAVGGLGVSALVVRAGGESLRLAVRELLDEAVLHDDERWQRVWAAVVSVPGVEPRDLQVFPSGGNVTVRVVCVQTPDIDPVEHSAALRAAVARELGPRATHVSVEWEA